MVREFNSGKSITREQYDTTMAGRQNPELVATILPDMPLSQRTALWQTKEKKYENIITKGVPPIPGLITLLEKCQKDELIHYIVKNAPKGSCKKTMESIGIARFFEKHCIVVAEECEFPKPHPAPYLRALELSDVSCEDAIVFEDSPSGTKAAVAAGIFTIGVRSTQSDKALKDAGAAFTVSDYTDTILIEFLKQYDS